jgi:hypothetical protein
MTHWTLESWQPMAADRPKPTLADYVTMAISPALIMALIDSLVFFLLAILYRGNYASRLHWILFFYVFGIVLVARIAMETGLSERAPLYGLVLSALVWLGMGSFVDYPKEVAAASWLINLFLIGLAWWLSYQLTYSCTYLDEKAESTGIGVLQAAGLEAVASDAADDQDQPQKNGKQTKKPRLSWWQRFQHFRAERKKSQPPGVWVVYFGVAALPIFGLGQTLIDVTDVARRNRTFWLMALYLASSLGLLVTTAFLGLRRYLRQRRLGMPKMVTFAWLVLGAVLVAIFVGVGAALPRPQSEFSLFAPLPDSDKPAASPYAVTRGELGEGKGRAGAQKRDAEGDPADSKNNNATGSGGKGRARGQGSGPKRNQTTGTRNSDKKPDEQRAGQANTNDERQTERSSESEQPNGSGDNPVNANPLASLSPLMSALKWIVFGVLGLITLFFVLRSGLRYLAHFTDWARRLLETLSNFWQGLFASPRDGNPADGGSEAVPEPTSQPFSAFTNPFRTGQAARMTPADLARYSFEALEAWAREQDNGRRTDESPIEFATRLVAEETVLGKDISSVGVLYARVLYAPGELPVDWSDVLKKFWQRLETIPSHEMPAHT